VTQSTLHIGVLGAARIAAGAIIPAARNVPSVRVLGVAARDPRRAKDYAAQHEIERVYESYDALLADPEIHAVYNPLPTNEHAPWTLKALEAGKHVLVEKSFAMDALEAQTVADAAQRTGLTVMEGFMWRFHPQVRQAQDILESGALGDLRLIRASFSFTLQNPLDIRAYAHLGGGASYDIATYCVSGSRTFAGREPVFVNGWQTLLPPSHPAGGGADEAFGGVLHFDGDLRAVIDSSLAQPFKQRLELVGTKGALALLEPWLPGRDHTRLLELNGEMLETEPANHYEPMLEHFARAVRGEVALRYPPEESVRQMRVLDALRKSALERGAPVNV
jgi:predicted dehydrogenase